MCCCGWKVGEGNVSSKQQKRMTEEKKRGSKLLVASVLHELPIREGSKHLTDDLEGRDVVVHRLQLSFVFGLRLFPVTKITMSLFFFRRRRCVGMITLKC